MSDLLNYREKIDEIDAKLISLLDKRFELSIKVGFYKKQNLLPIENSKREMEILNRIASICETQKKSKLVEEVYKEIFRISKSIQ